MYRIITYKSKPLKKNVIILEEETSSSDFNVENVEKGRKKKKQDDGLTYIIDGVEVREEDLTAEERLDIEADALLNQDGFYTPLSPIDIYDEDEDAERKKSDNSLKIILVVAGTVLLLAGIVVGMILIL